MKTGSISIDASEWPIVVHTAEGSPPNAAVDEYLRRATEILARGEPHVTILDARRTRAASAYVRERAREWIRAHEHELSAHCAGTVWVLDSALLRFALTTTLLFVRLPTPYRVCEDLDEAKAWARQRLAVLLR